MNIQRRTFISTAATAGLAGLCRLLNDGQTVVEKSQPCTVPALGEARLAFAIDLPADSGTYQLEAALMTPGADPVRSLRDFTTLTNKISKPK